MQKSMKKILIIEDDLIFSRMLENWLDKKQLPVISVSSAANARKVIKQGNLSLILSDLRLPDGDGVELLEWMNKQKIQIPFIIMTCYGQVDNAVKAIKLGAIDYLCKPLQPESLLFTIMETLNIENGATTNSDLTSYYQGKSAATLECRRMVELIAPTEIPVMICGANGTGKEYVARSIHATSGRSKKNFIAIDCGSIPLELAPSLLFGYVKGTFTGASDNKEGIFHMANGGTLFLDEVGNLDYRIQVLLLRALQEKRYRPIGAPTEYTMDVRIIAATNENLEKAVAEKRFREDLYHRLNEFTIHIPSLVECHEDIMPLAEYFREQGCRELKRNVDGFDHTARKVLERYTWPGNIREMRYKIRSAILLAKENLISEEDLHISMSTETSEILALKDKSEERKRIVQALKIARGNKRFAALLLQIDRSTLYDKIKKYGIDISTDYKLI